MKSKTVKALRLHRETLLHLDAAGLGGVRGGQNTFYAESCAGISVCGEPPAHKTKTEGTECCY